MPVITTLKSWRNKDELNALLKDKPHWVDITGDGLDKYGGFTQGGWTGLASDIPYGVKVMAKHKGKSYAFMKETNGTIRVY